MRWIIGLMILAFGLLGALQFAPVPATPTLPPTPPALADQANLNPLTGLPLSGAALTRRPILVKISNSPDEVRPQSGLGQADLVFEHYTEVGITRFSAIFLSQAPQRVGSVRSARLIDYELTPMYQALLAFAGASLGVDKRIYGNQFVTRYMCQGEEVAATCASDVLAVGPTGDLPPSDFVERAYKGTFYGEPIFFRDPTLPQPHNLFVNLRLLWERADRDGVDERPPLTGLRFDPTPPDFSFSSGIYARVRYLTTVADWYYDPPTNRYYRSTDDERHFDALTQTQIAADNVVILYAGHYFTDIVESGGGDNVNWSVQITLWPRGDALLLRDGRAYPVVWQRATRADLITYWTADGQPMPLHPGQTWVQVVRLPEQMDSDHEGIVIQ